MKAKEEEAVTVDAHFAGPDTMYIEWFMVPKEMRGRGIGRAAYEEWEKKLPKSVRYVTLHAADRSDPFWESLGFVHQWDFGYDPHPSDDAYESAHAMIKGIRGTRTPKTKRVEPDEP